MRNRWLNLTRSKPSLLTVLLVLGATLTVTKSAGAAESDSTLGHWPRWRGSSFDGVAPEQNIFSQPFSLSVRWRRHLGSGYSGVVVADHHAVTLFSDGRLDYLVALDADTGRESWRFPIAPTFPGREGATDGPVSTPAIESGTVFALGPRGDLVAVELASGELRWRVQLAERLASPEPHWGFSTSPLVAGDLLVVATGGAQGHMITAFDKRTGELAWHAGDDEVSYQSPILLEIAGRPHLIAAGDTSIVGLDPVTGSELWRHLHEGQQFYRRIINPVTVGEGGLVLTHRREQSIRIDLVTEDDQTRIDQTWTTPHLKLNYAPPLYENGVLYGYNGSFLSAIDAQTGELAWKSRPPGNGFPILVDGHLVVLTKRGTLHVAEATSRGYREKAALDLFSKLVWTPPSFAYRRVYARDSYSEVVCVDVVETTESTNPHAEAIREAPKSRFASWIETLEQAPDKAGQIQQWFAEQTAFPVIEEDHWAHIVYQGEADDLALRTSMLDITEQIPMRRVPGSNFFYASLELEPDARIIYQLVQDLGTVIPDPLNPRRSASLIFSGEVSQLLMPHAEQGPAATDRMANPQGKIESWPLESKEVRIGAKTWGGSREIQVYLPAGYEDDESRRYPTLYLLYGKAMLQQGGVNNLLDSLIGRRIQPVIAVFVETISAYEYARSQRSAHRNMIVAELVPLVDGRYRTLTEAAHRVIAGVDEAGFAAVELAVHHPRLFGKASAQSVLPIGKGGDQLLSAIPNADDKPLEIYLDWGRYDLRMPRDATDVRAYGRRLRAALAAQGHRVTGQEWNDGSDLPYWSRRLEPMLQEFFAQAGSP